MADQLKWLNKHYILFRHKFVQELIQHEGYKVPKNCLQLLTQEMSIEEFLDKLIAADALKEACNLIAYAIHRRVGVWWGLRCLKELRAEPPKPAAGDADKKAAADAPEAEAAAADAKKEELAPDLKAVKEDWEKTSKALAEKETGENGLNMIDGTVNRLTPSSQAVFWRTRQMVDSIFMMSTGMSFHHLLNRVSRLKSEQQKNPAAGKELDDLKKKLDKTTAELAKSPPDKLIFPAPAPDDSRERQAALDAVAEWILMPDYVQTQAALDCGNEVSDTAEGMLALSAYWSYGNLVLDNTDNIVRTPPGLAANGLRMALLMMILDERGSLSPRERVLRYLEIGQESARCRNLWTEDFSVLQSDRNAGNQPPPAAGAADTAAKDEVYSKWN